MVIMSAVPKTFKKLICHKLTSKFSEAAKIVVENTPELGANEVLVKNRYVGINASDINFTAGRYFADKPPPFDVGFEAVGEIAAKGSSVKGFEVGQPVGYMNHGAFSEYKVFDVSKPSVFPLPKLKAEYLPLFVSGLTAALALDKVAEVKPSDVVLVTAAAGGTGQFAVQWAKHKGCKNVIGTCSTDDKVEFLKSIGCDRAINYKTENLAEVLRKEYPNGVDVVYESIGGEIFETCVDNLAVHGRLVIIGMIAAYEEQKFGALPLAMLPMKLLRKSSSVRGFYLFHFNEDVPDYLRKLITLVELGQLKSGVDFGESTGKKFSGVEDVNRAVEFLYSQKSKGKVVVEINQTVSSL